MFWKKSKKIKELERELKSENKCRNVLADQLINALIDGAVSSNKLDLEKKKSEKLQAENDDLSRQLSELQNKYKKIGAKRDEKGRFAVETKSTDWSPAPEDKDFKVGDKVKIVDGFEPGKYRKTAPYFVEDMDSVIGKIGTVEKINISYERWCRVSFKNNQDYWNFDKNWLEKVK